MLKLGLILVIPYLAVASVATGAVDGTDTFDAIQSFVSNVSERSDEVADAIVHGGGDLDHKVTVCHLPDGDPEQARLLRIAMEAWAAHEAHGDFQLTDTALLTEPLLSRCADSTEVADDVESDVDGKPASNGNGPKDEGGDGEASNGPPEHSNAGGGGRDKQLEE